MKKNIAIIVLFALAVTSIVFNVIEYYTWYYEDLARIRFKEQCPEAAIRIDFLENECIDKHFPR